MVFTIRARNYRGLRRVDWAPEGVSVLVGPNGSGKTTLLQLLDFLRDALASDFVAAIEQNGGQLDFRHRDAGDEQVEFQVLCGDQRWLIRTQPQGEWVVRRPEQVSFALSLARSPYRRVTR